MPCGLHPEDNSDEADLAQRRPGPDPDRDRARVLRAADHLAAAAGHDPTYSDFIAQINNDSTADQVKSVEIKTNDNTINVTEHGRHRVLDRLPGQHRGAARQHARAPGHQHDRRGQGRLVDPLAAHLHPSLRPHLRVLDLPDEPDAGRRLAGHELRQVAGQADVGRRPQDHLPRRRRRRRGRPGAARDQGVPREPEEVPVARRADPQGRAALRASRHRQDPARARRRRRGGRAVLLDLRLRLRRDVRRRRRQPRPRPLRAGQAELPLHHLHGRDRRRRPPSRRRHGRRSRRARADPEPAPRRDGRLRR